MDPVAPFLVEPPAQRLAPWRVVVDGERTGGMVLGEAELAPRTPGPARHVHTREDEGLFVFSGVLTAEVGEERFEVGPGAFLFMPRGLPHTFANLHDEPVRGVGLINPPGLTRFFAEMAEYVAATAGEPDHETILEINARYGVFPAEGPALL
ncbi:MAG: cupin domain-containing protein [Nocardioidaceae bacterium]